MSVGHAIAPGCMDRNIQLYIINLDTEEMVVATFAICC